MPKNLCQLSHFHKIPAHCARISFLGRHWKSPDCSREPSQHFDYNTVNHQEVPVVPAWVFSLPHISDKRISDKTKWGPPLGPDPPFLHGAGVWWTPALWPRHLPLFEWISLTHFDAIYLRICLFFCGMVFYHLFWWMVLVMYRLIDFGFGNLTIKWVGM